jgi:hypothetical protein
MTRIALCGGLLCAACIIPQSPPQPSHLGNYEVTNDPAWSSCQQQANPQLSICQAVGRVGETNDAWQLRAIYDALAKQCPTHAHDGILGQLGTCVADLEAADLRIDPEAPARRDAARPRVDDTRAKPSFKALITKWTAALDNKNLACRTKNLSDSDRRACARSHAEMAHVENDLSHFLVAQGYDHRDFRVLGLWPVDPNWRISPD